MNPFIFHLFGPFAISWYGFLVVTGVSLFLYFAYGDMRRSAIASTTQFFDCAAAGILGGLLGGKLLFIVTEFGDVSIACWQDGAAILLGGFAILGAILGAIIGVVLMARAYKIDVIAALDLGGAYALIAHSVARLGCFISGCCYGMPVALSAFSVMYTHPSSLAPLHISLLPTQLIMSVVSLIGFFLCSWAYHFRGRRDGLTFSLYVLWESAARFIVDFWRGDRISVMYGLSVYQWVSLGIIGLMCLFLYSKVFAGKGKRRW
ncbi:MAG: phosphatidylglycerol---prolipoprotein diacylglyceryl transferase [Candidatus Dependentiae bacterium]|nr:phosphatidylglycerol---prolipoprotein diacylglyceryl transferase [Candidatus Dependentiae bacterium]